MRHVESYGPPELQRFLRSLGGRPRQNGGHRVYVMPNGAQVPCPAHTTVVTNLVADVAAKALGLTRQELEARVKGSEVSKTGKLKKAAKSQARRDPTRSDVLRSLNGCVNHARSLSAALTGQRDAAHYRRLLADTLKAEALLQNAAESAR